jgi:hypothetical protein
MKEAKSAQDKMRVDVTMQALEVTKNALVHEKALSGKTIANLGKIICDLEDAAKKAPDEDLEEEFVGVEFPHDEDDFQQPNPFEGNPIWHQQELGADDGNKLHELQVAFKRGLFSPFLPEAQVLVYHLLLEQNRNAKESEKKGEEGAAKSGVKEGAVWRG